IQAVPVDMVAPIDEIGRELDRLTSHPVPVRNPGGNSAVDDDFTERALEGGGALEMDGRPSRFTCPDCGGSLWEARDESETKFRCRVGHSWTSMALLEQQASTLEQALWTSLRALAERADLARRMRDHAAARDHPHARRLFEQQLEELEQKAEV